MSLRPCEQLEEIYLLGNPCTDFKEHREIVIALLDNVFLIDGKEVTPSERIIAK